MDGDDRIAPSSTSIIYAILQRDVREFTRNRFVVYITVAGLVFYVAFFWVMPATVDETFTIGVVEDGLDPVFSQFEGEGLEVVTFEDREALVAAIEAGEGHLVVGVVFPVGFVADLAGGRAPTVEVLLGTGVPADLRQAVGGLVREIAYLVAGDAPPVVFPEEQDVILGVDRAGDQIPLRDRMRPLLAFFILLMETFALATVVASEVQQRTLTSVLVTPARMWHVLTAKGLFGTGLAFVEAMVLMALIGALAVAPLELGVVLLLGSVLVTGFGLWAGSSGRDFVAVVTLSFAAIIPLAIPAVAAMIPGTAATWIRLLPSYGLVEAINGVTLESASLVDVSPHLLSLVGWSAAIFGVGALALRRKVAKL